MTRFVIDPDVALRLTLDGTPALPPQHRLLAPTLLRSQLLSRLYQAVRAGEMERRQADARLDRVRALRLRLLGDRVLQRVAWQLAEQLGWDDTATAEYVALTRLQADAFVTQDVQLRRALKGVVPVATLKDLLARNG
ncbi:MAG: hypothetical protein U1F56_04905 [Rubrivivax sp.]